MGGLYFHSMGNNDPLWGVVLEPSWTFGCQGEQGQCSTPRKKHCLFQNLTIIVCPVYCTTKKSVKKIDDYNDGQTKMYRVWNAMNIGGVVTWNKARFRLVGTGVLVGGLGGGGAFPQIKLNHGLFSIPYKWFINIREISFLCMPQIAHFHVEKWKSSLPHPPPARLLRSLGLSRFAPSQRSRPPKCFGSLRHCL